ncbi:MAG: LysR substrate-binding domain-containing protein [Nibricoccus sp.]
MLHASEMELRHLRYFVAVAEALHFSRAARRLNVSQPALSRQIRDLEDEIGVKLFLRHGTRTVLTKAGGHFMDRAREVLDLANRSVAEVQTLGREVRLGHYGTLWVDYYGPALRAFSKRFPKIALKAVEQTPVELVESLRCGEVDIALLGATEAALAEEFNVRRLGVLPALVAMSSSHPLAKRRMLSLADLRNESWIVWDERDFPGRLTPLREAAKRAGFSPRIAGKTDSVASLFVQLAGTSNVGYVLPMSKKLPHAGVVFAKLQEPGIALPMDVAWRKNQGVGTPITALANLLATVPPAS